MRLLNLSPTSGTIEVMGTDSERGFTLIELVVATLIVLLLLVAAVFSLRTNNYTLTNQDYQRQTDVARIVQALNKYIADNGKFPMTVPDKIVAISSGKDQYNLCSYLVPKYLPDLPIDPAYGVKMYQNAPVLDTVCTTPGLTYSTGYGIQRLKTSLVVVSSPLTNNNEISVPVPNSANVQ